MAGIIMFGIATIVAILCWRSSRWLGDISDLASPRNLALVALANSVVLLAAYFAIAALVWAFADATMPLLRDFDGFLAAPRARAIRAASLTCRMFML
jgi:hypothetical protein